MQLLGLENVLAEDESSVVAALALIEHGVEFADAMHWASTPRGASFVTFDRSFQRRA